MSTELLQLCIIWISLCFKLKIMLNLPTTVNGLYVPGLVLYVLLIK